MTEIPTNTHHPNPLVTTVKNIYDRFSRLSLNHKALSSLSQRPSPNTTVFVGPTTACLTKSQSQRTNKKGKSHYYFFNKSVNEDEDKSRNPL
ncbi:hypothetical protein R6Q59_023957 [Mikania micrantha]